MFRFLVVFAVLMAVYAELRVQMERDVKFDGVVPKFWLKESNAKDRIKAVFVLKHDPAAMKKYEKDLLDRATPKSKNYGKWFTIEEIKKIITPAEASIKAVIDFISSFSGVEYKLSTLGDMIFIDAPVELAESMFDTKFATFRSIVSPLVTVQRVTKPYSLPESIAAHVSIVDDLIRLPSIRKPMVTVGSDATVTGDTAFDSCGKSCSGDTTPAVLQQAYNIKPVTSVASGNSVAVAEFQYQYFDTKDLDAFSSACSVDVSVTSVIGGNKESLCEKTGCVEALLDIEYLGALTNPIPLTVVYQGDFSLLTWAESVLSMANAPLVHSVSYGNDEVQQTSTDYMYSVNEQLALIAGQGISVLFASGDQGVWGRTGYNKRDPVFNPDFPASSPYVTSVGGTNFQTKSTIGAESAWDCGGGGFSNTFPQPDWQTDVVSEYFTLAGSKLPDSSAYNASGRAYPDVSALGGQTNGYCVSHAGGKFDSVAGTSAACPVVASMISMLNNVRLAAGKSSLGWLNPFLYATETRACFNDVNDGTQNNCEKGTTGFVTVDGFDPATGFGSINYECMAGIV